MIQELLCGGRLVEERKLPIQGGFLLDGMSPSSAPATPPSSSSSAISSPSSSSAAAAGGGGGDGSSGQSLRCPRCDSTNTKFCYYNNYNLTQPRHFCKTCRRYWTKGGALRNVPIGGGCRKTKTTGASIGGGPGAVSAAAAAAKPGFKRSFSLDAASVLAGKPGLGGYGHELQGYSSPILWSPTQQSSSNLLSLIRATQSSSIATAFQNPNPNPNSFRVKEELSHLVPDATLVTNALNARSSGLAGQQQLDAMGHVQASFCTPLWRNNGNQYHQYHQQQQLQEEKEEEPQHHHHHHHQQQQQQQHSLFGAEAPSSGIQDLYQRLRTNNYFGDLQTQVLLGNVGGGGCTSSSSSASAAASSAAAVTTAAAAAAANMLEPSAITGGEIGVWNLPLSWSDMPATNGAFP